MQILHLNRLKERTLNKNISDMEDDDASLEQRLEILRDIDKKLEIRAKEKIKKKNKEIHMEQIFYDLMKYAEERIGDRGCNDYEIPNTPEAYRMIEEYQMRNLGCKTIEEYKIHPEYEDYKPQVNKKGDKIFIMDWQVFQCLIYKLEEKGIIKK